MIHADFADPRVEAAPQELVGAHRLAAARAFRVLRDLRTLAAGDATAFVVRPAGQEFLAAFLHPGLWSVTLEPEVGVFDRTGQRLWGEIGRSAGLETVCALLARNPGLSVAARAYAPHLAAFAATGADFTFVRGRAPARRFKAVADDLEAVAAAADPANAGALLPDGRLVVWSEGDIAAAAELIAFGEQAAQIRYLAVGFGLDQSASAERPRHAAIR